MHLFKKYGIITAGSFIFALSINLFTLPSKIVTGGISGVATIFYHLFGISTGLTVGLLNIVILLFAWKILGKHFVLDSLAAIVMIPFFLEFTEHLPPLTENILLAAAYGGVLLGVGIGMAFSQGGTTGGTDIVSRISQKKYPHLSIGILMTIVDLLIIGASIVAFGNIDLALYGILSLVISTAVIDMIISKLNCAKLVFIITDSEIGLETHIFTAVNRGVTTISGVGGFSGKAKKILLCVAKQNQVEKLKNTVRQFDPSAFIIVNESKEIIGNGFQYYR